MVMNSLAIQVFRLHVDMPSGSYRLGGPARSSEFCLNIRLHDHPPPPRLLIMQWVKKIDPR